MKPFFSPRRFSNLPFLAPSWLSRRLFYPLWDVREGARLKELKALEASQWRSPSKEEIWQRLHSFLSYALVRCPYYQEKNYGMPRSIEEFGSLPLLFKDDVRTYLDKLLSDDYLKSELISTRTGGSTGVSLKLYFDQECQVKRNAAAFRSDRWAGWKLGEPRGALWGNPPAVGSWKEFLRHALLDRTIYLDTLELNEASMKAFVRQLQRHRVRFLFGHAHSLYIFANYVKSQGKHLRMKGIVSTSMTLLASERAVIEAVFGCPVTNRYGCEETGLIASECEEHKGLHLNTDHLYVELLLPDGSPARPGEEGLIVVTDLANKGMPLIRYVVGDKAVATDRRCACGRGMPLLEKITGRLADFLVKPDGSLVAGVSLIERTLTLIPGLAQMQLVQHSLYKIQIRVVPDEAFTAQSMQKLLKAMQEVFGSQTSFEITIGNQLKQEKNGKYRFSICHVSTPYQLAAAG